MNKKIKILLILFTGFTINSFGQKCTGQYEVGDYFINEMKKGTVCFKRETEKRSDNIFFTRYTFKAEGGRETYYLDFSFYNELNKIVVRYTNQENIESEPKQIKFDPEGSVILFKDYRANDTTINKEEFCNILFSIPQKEKPYISLYHFELMDNGAVIFKLNDISNEKISYHKAISTAFLLRTTTTPVPTLLSTNSISNTSKILDLKLEINEYSDSIKKQIEIDDQGLMEKLWPRKAEGELLNKITNRLNSEFYKYLKNVFPYQNISCQIDFNFNYGADGKNLTLKNMYFINSLPVKWLEDSIRAFILPKLNQLVFEPMTLTLNNNNLENNYKKRFNDKISRLNLNDKNAYDLNENSKKIIENLDNLSKRTQPVNTEFTYKLGYQSKIKFEVWKYEQKSRKGGESLIIENSNEQITPPLRTLFFSNIILEKKKSKYNVKRTEVSINNEKPVEDLKPNY